MSLVRRAAWLPTNMSPHVPHVIKECKTCCVCEFSFNRSPNDSEQFLREIFSRWVSTFCRSLSLIDPDEKGLRDQWYNVVIILSGLLLFRTIFPNDDLDKVANGVRRKAFPRGAAEQEGRGCARLRVVKTARRCRGDEGDENSGREMEIDRQ